MNYKELQEEAKELGLKHIGVSKKKLEKMIEQEKDNDSDEPVDSPETVKPRKVNKKVNAAIIFNGKHEVRRYTAEVHGENFADLAREFSNAHEYKVELIEVKPGVKCLNCGTMVNI